MYADLSESERRELARRALDAAESWIRKIVDQQLSRAHGANYFDTQLAGDTPVIPKKVRNQARFRIQKEPGRFERPIDALTFGELTTIGLHPEHYKTHFRQALDGAYPDGAAEARTFLSRLEDYRNQIAHQGTCSLRELERCVCYSNDLAGLIKGFLQSAKHAAFV